MYRAKLDAKLQLGTLTNPRLLHMLFWAIGLHAVRNFGLINPAFFTTYWILGSIAWVLVLSMLHTGFKAPQTGAAFGRRGRGTPLRYDDALAPGVAVAERFLFRMMRETPLAGEQLSWDGGADEPI